MKRKFVKISFVVAIAMIGGINVFNAQKSEALSDIALANEEALAQSEGTDLHITCYSGTKGSTAFLCKCGSCVWGYTYTTNKSTCY